MHKSTIETIASHLHLQVTDIQGVSGGDISKAYRLVLSNNTNIFVKCSSDLRSKEMFEKEIHGLNLIRSTNSISVPRIILSGFNKNESFLCLEYIESKATNSNSLNSLGEKLALLHQSKQEYFGLETDNFIGSLPQKNDIEADWPKFYATNRLHLQFKIAVDNNHLVSSEIPDTEHVIEKLASLIPCKVSNLLHGDLWGGNYMISQSDMPYVIDPAVYYGDGIVDIAMSKLFGGFGNEFYDSYFHYSDKVYNLEERIDLYQLYYLLVHLNIFGKAYYSQVKELLNRYF